MAGKLEGKVALIDAVAADVLYLALEDARWVTGTERVADDGLSAEP